MKKIFVALLCTVFFLGSFTCFAETAASSDDIAAEQMSAIEGFAEMEKQQDECVNGIGDSFNPFTVESTMKSLIKYVTNKGAYLKAETEKVEIVKKAGDTAAAKKAVLLIEKRVLAQDERDQKLMAKYTKLKAYIKEIEGLASAEQKAALQKAVTAIESKDAENKILAKNIISGINTLKTALKIETTTAISETEDPAVVAEAEQMSAIEGFAEIEKQQDECVNGIGDSFNPFTVESTMKSLIKYVTNKGAYLKAETEKVEIVKKAGDTAAAKKAVLLIEKRVLAQDERDQKLMAKYIKLKAYIKEIEGLASAEQKAALQKAVTAIESMDAENKKIVNSIKTEINALTNTSTSAVSAGTEDSAAEQMVAIEGFAEMEKQQDTYINNYNPLIAESAIETVQKYLTNKGAYLKSETEKIEAVKKAGDTAVAKKAVLLIEKRVLAQDERDQKLMAKYTKLKAYIKEIEGLASAEQKAALQKIASTVESLDTQNKTLVNNIKAEINALKIKLKLVTNSTSAVAKPASKSTKSTAAKPAPKPTKPIAAKPAVVTMSTDTAADKLIEIRGYAATEAEQNRIVSDLGNEFTILTVASTIKDIKKYLANKEAYLKAEISKAAAVKKAGNNEVTRKAIEKINKRLLAQEKRDAKMITAFTRFKGFLNEIQDMATEEQKQAVLTAVNSIMTAYSNNLKLQKQVTQEIAALKAKYKSGVNETKYTLPTVTAAADANTVTTTPVKAALIDKIIAISGYSATEAEQNKIANNLPGTYDANKVNSALANIKKYFANRKAYLKAEMKVIKTIENSGDSTDLKNAILAVEKRFAAQKARDAKVKAKFTKLVDFILFGDSKSITEKQKAELSAAIEANVENTSLEQSVSEEINIAKSM